MASAELPLLRTENLIFYKRFSAAAAALLPRLRLSEQKNLYFFTNLSEEAAAQRPMTLTA